MHGSVYAAPSHGRVRIIGSGASRLLRDELTVPLLTSRAPLAVPSKEVSVCTSVMKLANASATQMVAFKVKTTALKRYVVRPNVGVIEPGKAVEVSVLLNYEQARVENVDLATVRDRFQVVAIGIENAGREDLLSLWNNPSDAVMSKTIVKCKFVRPSQVKTAALLDSPGDLSMNQQQPPQPFSTPTTFDASRDLPGPASVSRGGSGDDFAHDTSGVNANPTLEQAKQVYRNEMAASKLKKEVAALREEKGHAEDVLRERDEHIFRLEDELKRLRAQVASGGGGGAAGASGSRKRARVLPAVGLLLLYLLLLFVSFFVLFKATGIDPLASLDRAVAMRTWEAKLARIAHIVLEQ